jgi:hypothetical protein
MALMVSLKLRRQDRVGFMGQEMCHKRLPLEVSTGAIYFLAA